MDVGEGRVDVLDQHRWAGPLVEAGRGSCGGELTCHSSVSARHGFAPALAPPRHDATML